MKSPFAWLVWLVLLAGCIRAVPPKAVATDQSMAVLPVIEHDGTFEMTVGELLGGPDVEDHQALGCVGDRRRGGFGGDGDEPGGRRRRCCIGIGSRPGGGTAVPGAGSSSPRSACPSASSSR